MSSCKYAYGIDLGTCTCFTSSIMLNVPRMLDIGNAVDNGSYIIPSVLAYSKSSEEIKVGIAAASIHKENDYTILYDSKRFIGKTAIEVDEEELKSYPFHIKNYNNELLYTIDYNKKEDLKTSATDASSEILKYINGLSIHKVTNDKEADQKDFQIVIGVTAVFSYDQREETKKQQKKLD